VINEEIVRLPYGRFCYTSPVCAPEPSETPALRRRFVTFGSSNNVGKINCNIVALWARPLQAMPGSRLVLKWGSLDNVDERSALRAAFAAAGVANERMELRGLPPHAEMLAQYADLDIALDPFPFGGGLTNCEALWMSVPVVTLNGDRPASWQTAGFLAAIGLSNCVTGSPEHYVRLAAALAPDASRLATPHQALRPAMKASPLCGGARFRPTLESAFRATGKNAASSVSA
jgi:protein O-GlcNAc transferase